jgi:IS30 family transposase
MNQKTYEQIQETERHAIALGLQQKLSIRAIARALGRSPSTISRALAKILKLQNKRQLLTNNCCKDKNT